MQSTMPDSQQHSQRLARSANAMRSTSSPFDRTRSEGTNDRPGVMFSTNVSDTESWIEIASQPSSSSLSSVADEIVTTGLRVQDIARRRRRPRSNLVPAQPSHRLRSSSGGDISSQEEYEESESESDRVMTSSNEGLVMGGDGACLTDDENRTAVNYPLRGTETAFTPQPNAFSHPPYAYNVRTASEPGPGSYFPPQLVTRSDPRPTARHSFCTQDTRVRHYPHNAASHSQSAAAHHDAALRASLSTLLSCAAAARGLPKARTQQAAPQPRPTNRVDTASLRLIPESALPGARSPVRANTLEPSFLPTLRQRSPSSTSGGSPDSLDAHKRKSNVRATSKERRLVNKKPRRASSSSSASTVYSAADDVFVSPTLLTWVVSAGVVVVLSAISFSAGYSIGREAGKVEASSFAGVGGDVGSCAAEAGRGGIGLRRLRFTAQA